MNSEVSVQISERNSAPNASLAKNKSPEGENQTQRDYCWETSGLVRKRHGTRHKWLSASAMDRPFLASCKSQIFFSRPVPHQDLDLGGTALIDRRSGDFSVLEQDRPSLVDTQNLKMYAGYGASLCIVVFPLFFFFFFFPARS